MSTITQWRIQRWIDGSTEKNWKHHLFFTHTSGWERERVKEEEGKNAKVGASSSSWSSRQQRNEISGCLAFLQKGEREKKFVSPPDKFGQWYSTFEQHPFISERKGGDDDTFGIWGGEVEEEEGENSSSCQKIKMIWISRVQKQKKSVSLEFQIFFSHQA